MATGTKLLKYLILVLAIQLFLFSYSTGQSYDVDTIQYNGDPGKFINIVFLGDGYLESELADFLDDASEVSNYMFAQSPLLEYRNYFNVWAISVPSPESGVDHPATATDVNEPVFPESSVNTFFNSTFDYASIHRLLVAQNGAGINSVIIQNFPLADQVLVLVNTPHYGGSGGSRAVASLHASAAEIMIHEIGHSFAGLADEYYAGDQYANERPNMTQETNPNQVRWKNWIGNEGIGIYQHCCDGNSAEWYRPHQACKMRFLGVDHPFCAVCRERIIEEIHDRIGVPVSAFHPAESIISSCGDSMHFSIDAIAPDPNTLQVEWFLNDVSIQVNTDDIFLGGNDLNAGQNILRIAIIDGTGLSRHDDHPTDHNYQHTWTINHEPADEPVIIVDGSTMICPGESVTLVCESQGDLVWSTGETSQNILVSSEGSYDVTVTNAYGCVSLSDQIIITELPVPHAEILEGSMVQACPGKTTTLTANSGSTYHWNTGESTQTITVMIPGQYSVTVTDNTGCTAASDTALFSYYDVPEVYISQTGGGVLCTGDTIELTAFSGEAFQWSTGDTTQTIAIHSGGSYSVEITSIEGCSSQESIHIFEHAPPDVIIDILGPHPFCDGDSVTLHCLTPGDYQWNTGDTSQSVVVRSSGNYSVTLEDSNGCIGVSSSFEVTAFPLPTIPFVEQLGDTLISSSKSGNQWYLDNILIPGAIDDFFVAQLSGEYQVVVTDSNGCSASSEPFLFELTGTTSVSQDDLVAIIPNPSNGLFQLLFARPTEKWSVMVYTMPGELIHRSENQEYLDLRQLPPGIYPCLFQTDKGIFLTKLVIQ